VDIDAGNEAVARMKAAVQATYTPEVLGGIGNFGGLFDAARLKAMREPVLVASTDGVGTKVKLAAIFGRYESIGHDIVNHCINDILVQGARPLFFLDYIAASKLDPARIAAVVKGMAEACRAAGCVLLGGETAEMPGVYVEGAFDVAGTIVGVVEREAMLPRRDEIAPGDVLIGLASSGPHTNGYSLIRAVLPIKALAHITGGGFVENVPRVLPPGLRAEIDYTAWPMPPIFELIQTAGGIGDAEMRRVFNCGIGMVMIVHATHVEAIRAALDEPSWVVGEVVRG
jgi:phosphoribosylaminoimidazole (AIR) synthetase